MITPNNWIDYELLDAGGGEKLERWGSHVLRRPDPEAIWTKTLPESEWTKADATYVRKGTGGGWKGDLPEQWEIGWEDLRFIIKPTGFKHTGLFPEQAVHWAWLRQQLDTRHSTLDTREHANVLNLFGYTGGSTVACAKAGASVTHVDSSKGIVTWAKENCELNGVADKVRFIVDDVVKFVAREEKRGVRYDGIIMDPPVYGRGTEGSTWKLDEMLAPLVQQCARLLSDKPLFFLINSYVAGVSPTALKNILTTSLERPSNMEADEIGLTSTSGLVLPAGVFARWSSQ